MKYWLWHVAAFSQDGGFAALMAKFATAVSSCHYQAIK
jgi:hypothetical protein